MKTLLLPLSPTSAVAPIPPSRRDFLKVGAVAIGAAVMYASLPRRGQASPATKVGRLNAADYRSLVRQYISDAVPNSEDAQRQIDGAIVHPTRPGTSFHAQFGASFTLSGVLVPALQAEDGFWVKVDNFARADSRRDVRDIKDMSETELRRTLNPSEIATYGSILHPCGERHRPNAAETANFERVAETCYGADPSAFNVNYCRPFRDARDDRSYLAYGVASRSDPRQKDLLIDVATV